MHEPHHVVEVAVVRHRRPGVGTGRQLVQGLLGGPVRFEHEHVGPGDQHLVERALRDLERAIDDHALLGGERGLGTDHLPQLGLGDLLALRWGRRP